MSHSCHRRLLCIHLKHRHLTQYITAACGFICIYEELLRLNDVMFMLTHSDFPRCATHASQPAVWSEVPGIVGG